MDDIRAVLDACGVERAALVGISEGGPLAILFAATYPERVSHLVAVRLVRLEERARATASTHCCDAMRPGGAPA